MTEAKKHEDQILKRQLRAMMSSSSFMDFTPNSHIPTFSHAHAHDHSQCGSDCGHDHSTHTHHSDDEQANSSE